MVDVLYISQRAANSIIAGVAPYRISSEALQAINNFLDEFLYYLIDAAHSLDLVRIKTAISTVLPTSVGKNAVSEAELELKTYVESGNSDNTKERTIEITPFPLQKVFEQFRIKCQYYSTLGDREGDDTENAVPDLCPSSDGIHIAPSLAIYLTAVLEYVGENILFLVAKTSEKHKVEVAKAREVYTALSEDPQISPLFLRMDLKAQMEVAKYGMTPVNGYSPSSPTRTSLDSAKSSRSGPSLNKHHRHNGSGDRKESVDEMSMNGSNGSSYSRISMELKSPRSTKSSSEKESDMRSVSSLEDSGKMKNFDQLLTGSQTMKVSLTPNRLITIETHKRPPKLAPREPVSRERIIQPSGPTVPSNNKIDESDDLDDDLFPQKGRKQDKESLYEFLKNTSPDDVLGNKSNFKNKSATRRVKSIDQLEPVPEQRPTSPKYVSLIATASSLPSSPSYSSGQHRKVSPGPLHKNVSGLDRSNSKASMLSSKSAGNPDTRSSITKKSKRRHQAQDLMDFLATTPPSEKTSFSQADLPPVINNGGKKKEKKFKKFFTRFRKSSFSDDQSLYEQPLTRLSSLNSLGTSNVPSSDNLTKTNKPPRYVKIEIPPLPKTEEKQEPSIFDQVEIQGRHARHLSKTISLNSPRSGHNTPNKATFSSNERKPLLTYTGIYDEEYEDTHDKHDKRSTARSSIMAGSGFNTPTKDSYNTKNEYLNQQNTSALKTPPPSPSRNISNSPKASSPQQTSYNIPISQQRDNSTRTISHEDQTEMMRNSSSQSTPLESEQFIARAKSVPHSSILVSTVTTKIKSTSVINNIEETKYNNHHNHDEIPSSINDININENYKYSENASPVTITITPVTQRKLTDGSPLIEESAEIVDTKEVSSEVVCESVIIDEGEEVEQVDKEKEREEALVVEWLLGTGFGFGFKNNITYLDVVDIEDGGVTDEDEYVEAVDDSDSVMDNMNYYRDSGSTINAL
ncbi:4093_t:CDS:2 [Ambispora leptoticha]|uniref:4093_t:CDS:1 n=1 Tax=Ambispora leptoticha TaxID=144679 RepID=A0A9N9GB92_9GLOM|nr:4093_t:CDS:2 [Ambispora leptoticha]